MAKKIMISVDENLLTDIEDYAKKMHLNRSASFSVLCSTALQAQKGMNTLDELLQAYKAEKLAQDVKQLEGDPSDKG